MNDSNATKRISPEMQQCLKTLETLLQAEREKPGMENLDRLTLQIVCDGRAMLFAETHRGHTIAITRFYRDGDSGNPNNGQWVEEIPRYLQQKG